MNFGSIGSMNNAGMLLNLIAKKQKALGENLANVDTPGYVRKDVDFSQSLNSIGGSNSLENKLSSKFGPSPTSIEESSDPVNAPNELLAIQKNYVLYSMATRQMSSIITQMKTVINVGK